MTDQLVTRHDEDRVAVLTLDSPANRNALSGRLLDALAGHLGDIAEDESLHAVLLRSSGTVFCSGADLKEAATVDMVARAQRIIDVQRALAACPVPVVAEVAGAARAGGLGIVASCDLAVCADGVTFALTEVRLGLAASVISIPLTRRVAPRTLSDWLLTGRVVTAEEAYAAGLVSHLAPAADLAARTETVLDDLRRGIRQGLVAAKALVNRPLVAAFDTEGPGLAALSGELFHSDVAQQAMRAALGGREAR